MNNQKKRRYLIIILIIIINHPIFPQWVSKGCDEVLFFHPGSGQSLGQKSPYFPNNIFGLPDTNATESIPSSSPEHICSLGLDGKIAVGFSGYFLHNRPGADFIIFENAFINPITGKVFAEPAVVSVSIDGVNFIDFPCDSITLEGCAGKTPTNGKNNPFDTLVSGGDSFDLGILGLDYIKYIKIKDISKVILNNPNHHYYDPIISGFDLDAVVGLALSKETSVDLNEIYAREQPPFLDFLQFIQLSNNKLFIDLPCNYILEIITIEGKIIFQKTTIGMSILNLQVLSNGFYIIVVKSQYFNKSFKYFKYE